MYILEMGTLAWHSTRLHMHILQDIYEPSTIDLQSHLNLDFSSSPREQSVAIALRTLVNHGDSDEVSKL